MLEQGNGCYGIAALESAAVSRELATQQHGTPRVHLY